MLDFGFYNMDCMEGMKEFPDKYFDLAIVDPPHIYIYSHSGYIATLSRGQEHYYTKIGHIDLKPLLEQIKGIGK